MFNLLTSNSGIIAISFVLGGLIDHFFLGKKNEKIIKALIHAVRLVLEEYNVPYDEVMLKIIHNLKLTDENTKDIESKVIDEMDELKNKVDK